MPIYARGYRFGTYYGLVIVSYCMVGFYIWYHRYQPRKPLRKATYPGVRALLSTQCRGERNGVGRKEENGYGKGDRNRKCRPMWAERDHKEENGEVGASKAGSGVRRTKIHTLVGDVLEYRSFYMGEGAD